MGNFSRAEEGILYQDKYCNRCVHDVNRDCPVWLIHLVFNDTDDSDLRSAMDALIPREGIYNHECKMFIARDG